MRKLELVRQTEVTECGLACLAMIASYHGRDVNLAGLRARFGTSSRGVTLRMLIKIASDLGLSSRAVRLDLEALPHLRLPAMAHWDLDHFVVIESATSKGIVVFDPARGVREYTPAEITHRFTGVALELEPSDQKEPIRHRIERLRLSDIARQIPNFWTAAAQVAALALLLQIIYLATPLFVQNVIDKVLPGSDIGLLNVLALIFATVYVLSVLCDAVSAWVSLQFGHTIAFITIRRLFVHMLRLPLEWFESRGTGDILGKIQSQRPIQEIFISTIPGMLSDAIVVITTSIVITFYSPFLSAIVFVSLGAVGLVNFLFYPALLKREEEGIAASVAEHGYMVDTLRSIRVIRAFGGEAERESAWRNHFGKVVNSGIRIGKFRVYMRAVQGLINSAQTVLVLYLAALLIIRDPNFTIGMLFAFLFFRQSLVEKTNSLIQRFVTLRLAKLHLERLSDVLLAAPEPGIGSTSGSGDENVQGSISLSNVWMRYGADSRPVVRGAEIEIQAGEFIAIVGPTGGGKTSLVKLMAGLSVPYSGEILVDGVSLEQFGRSRWREHIGTVMQDDTLLSGTIADNISFFDPDLDMDRVRSAAMMAAIADDIKHMPMRYWTWIGDMGSALSGGQRQRILIARALYNDPKVLFLDEGTANLDTDTERAIVDTISGLTMTRVIIAHRPALVSRAGRVFSVDSGVLTELVGDSESLATKMASATLAPNSEVNRIIEPPAGDA